MRVADCQGCPFFDHDRKYRRTSAADYHCLKYGKRIYRVQDCKNSRLLLWQKRQNQIDEYFCQNENYWRSMEDCALVTGYEFIEDDDLSIKHKLTWVETGETVILSLRQKAQGIPNYIVVGVDDLK